VPLRRFNHEQHLKLGNLAPVLAAAIDQKTYLSDPGDMRRHLNSSSACAACHRGLAESDRVTAAALPKMADCLVCHSKIDPPFSCETCHEPGPHLRPANHSRGFLDRHADPQAGLDRTTCAVCHGRQFTCQGCH
jgi:hypothetical protein